MSAPFTELEKPLDEYATLCRGCLAESGEMKNMLEWGLVDEFYYCTSIKLAEADGLSVLLCAECETSLKSCRRFKAACLDSDYFLRTTAKKSKHINTLDRAQNQDNTISCVLVNEKLILMITAPNMATKIHLSCPYCQSSYIKQRDLLIHILKTHKVNKDAFGIELQYYCSVESCSYYINSGKNKYFQARKFLNQHYNKVHSDKKYICHVCNMTYSTETLYNHHFKTCNVTYICQICDVKYNSNDKLMVHLLRRHPALHKQYKNERKALKRKSSTVTEGKRFKNDSERLAEFASICDGPRRSFATQTKPEDNIKNDVTLPPWHTKNDNFEIKTDEISTQTGYEDILSLKSQTSEDESIFFSETVSLSDIQTQTFPLEFGLSRSNKETETQSPDISIKETQTCVCLCESPNLNLRHFDSVSSSPYSVNSVNVTTSETQTLNSKCAVKSDVLLSFSSAQTQTSFEDCLEKTF